MAGVGEERPGPGAAAAISSEMLMAPRPGDAGCKVRLVMVSGPLSAFGHDFRELYLDCDFNRNLLLKSLFLSWEI